MSPPKEEHVDPQAHAIDRIKRARAQELRLLSTHEAGTSVHPRAWWFHLRPVIVAPFLVLIVGLSLVTKPLMRLLSRELTEGLFSGPLGLLGLETRWQWSIAWTLAALISILPITVVGCVLILGSPTALPTLEPVPWGHYEDLLQTRIDQRAALGDCRGLQREMDTILAKSDATFADYGHDSTALLDYIATKMTQADCTR